MKTQTAIALILNSDASEALKISKLQTLALRTFPSSPAQKTVIAAYKALQGAECLRLQREHNAQQTTLGACVILPLGHPAETDPAQMRAEISKASNP